MEKNSRKIMTPNLKNNTVMHYLDENLNTNAYSESEKDFLKNNINWNKLNLINSQQNEATGSDANADIGASGDGDHGSHDHDKDIKGDNMDNLMGNNCGSSGYGDNLKKINDDQGSGRDSINANHIDSSNSHSHLVKSSEGSPFINANVENSRNLENKKKFDNLIEMYEKRKRNSLLLYSMSEDDILPYESRDDFKIKYRLQFVENYKNVYLNRYKGGSISSGRMSAKQNEQSGRNSHIYINNFRYNDINASDIFTNREIVENTEKCSIYGPLVEGAKNSTLLTGYMKNNFNNSTEEKEVEKEQEKKKHSLPNGCFDNSNVIAKVSFHELENSLSNPDVSNALEEEKDILSPSLQRMVEENNMVNCEHSGDTHNIVSISFRKEDSEGAIGNNDDGNNGGSGRSGRSDRSDRSDRSSRSGTTARGGVGSEDGCTSSREDEKDSQFYTPLPLCDSTRKMGEGKMENATLKVKGNSTERCCEEGDIPGGNTNVICKVERVEEEEEQQVEDVETNDNDDNGNSQVISEDSQNDSSNNTSDEMKNLQEGDFAMDAEREVSHAQEVQDEKPFGIVTVGRKKRGSRAMSRKNKLKNRKREEPGEQQSNMMIGLVKLEVEENMCEYNMGSRLIRIKKECIKEEDEKEYSMPSNICGVIKVEEREDTVRIKEERVDDEEGDEKNITAENNEEGETSSSSRLTYRRIKKEVNFSEESSAEEESAGEDTSGDEPLTRVNTRRMTKKRELVYDDVPSNFSNIYSFPLKRSRSGSEDNSEGEEKYKGKEPEVDEENIFEGKREADAAGEKEIEEEEREKGQHEINTSSRVKMENVAKENVQEEEMIQVGDDNGQDRKNEASEQSAHSGGGEDEAVALGEVALGEVTLGEVTLGEVTHGEVTHGEVAHGEVAHGEVTLGEDSPGENRTILRVKKEAKNGGSSADIEARTCSICNSLFVNSKLMQRHMMSVHSGERPYECEICFKRYKRADHLKIHRMKHDVNKEEMKFQCPICHLFFKTSKQMNNCKSKHMMAYPKGSYSENNSVPNENGESEENPPMGVANTEIVTLPVSGDEQGESYESGRSCERGGRDALVNAEELGEGKVKKEESTSSNISIEIRTCNVCNMIFANKKLMKRHLMSVHSDSRPYKCEMCTKTYKRSDHLKKHILTHKDNKEKIKYTCLICEISFDTPKELRTHKIRHYTCPYENCSYSYSTISKMKYHLNKHKCNLFYTCPVCTKKFLIYKDFIQHKRGCFKKKYVCLQCNKIYLHVNGYNKHIRKVHLNIIQTYKCTINNCNKEFSSEFSLKEHIINFHHRVKRFFCSKCNMSFGYRSSFRRHNINLHP
ncbi:krox-like protein. putative [Plasmodium ovale wallikeri]|uniref:Krox-like protein. putative n=1 Tax=Plasmodium ovale wallikeri TaxID=864142 RepID=A0A1A8YIB9_PLAOA|nr:krox-like protein. putative [Plasmodium ovale wallikeri]